jgi:hypothetical protein
MTKKKKPFSFGSKKTDPFVPGGVSPRETEELVKSIARDLQAPDRPLSMKELSELMRPNDQRGEHDVFIDLGPSKLSDIENAQLEIERNMIDRIDSEMDEE